MNLGERIRKQENLHIVFWLIKDSCWMLEIKWFGAAMVLPALAIAILIIYNTRKSREVYINTAIFFWITANSYWMIMEFFYDDAHKNYASIPFGIGFIFVGIYYYKSILRKGSAPEASTF